MLAGAPRAITPPSSRRAARHPPRVCALKAALAVIRSVSVWCRVAARTAAHGSIGVTGVSEPNASATPARFIDARAFMGWARSTPSRCAYKDSVPPQ
jgi:hypothetical protein